MKIFSPASPFPGKTHRLPMGPDTGRTVCGRSVLQTPGAMAVFGTRVKFGWFVAEVKPGMHQPGRRFCRACFATTAAMKGGR